MWCNNGKNPNKYNWKNLHENTAKKLYDLYTSILQDNIEMEYSLKPVLYLGIVITSA